MFCSITQVAFILKCSDSVLGSEVDGGRSSQRGLVAPCMWLHAASVLTCRGRNITASHSRRLVFFPPNWDGETGLHVNTLCGGETFKRVLLMTYFSTWTKLKTSSDVLSVHLSVLVPFSLFFFSSIRTEVGTRAPSGNMAGCCVTDPDVVLTLDPASRPPRETTCSSEKKMTCFCPCCDDNCVPKQASFWFQRRRLFGESEARGIFLYSCTFIFTTRTVPFCFPLDNMLLEFLSSNTDLHRLSNSSSYSENFLRCTLIKLF